MRENVDIAVLGMKHLHIEIHPQLTNRSIIIGVNNNLQKQALISQIYALTYYLYHKRSGKNDCLFWKKCHKLLNKCRIAR